MKKRIQRIQWEHYGVDALSWGIGLVLAALLRYNFGVTRINWTYLAGTIALAAFFQFLYGYLFKVYLGRHPWSSFDGLRSLGLTIAMVTFSLGLAGLLGGPVVGLARSLVLIAFPFAVIIMFAARYVGRALTEAKLRPRDDSVPVILFGAGYVGASLAKRLATDRRSGYRAVAFVDDDPAKEHLHLSDVPVRGTLADLEDLIEETQAEHVIVALGDPPKELLKEINTAARNQDINVLIMPPMEKMLQTGINENRLQDLKIEDLLGRKTVDTNVSEIAGYLNGKRVLVTGAGGSIGSQLCEQIYKHGPAELIMLDRDETGLQQTEIAITGNGLLNTNEVVLADIRDEQTLEIIFRERRPEVVFHAAALKHLPMLEQYPSEAWQTNVLGTLNVLEAARNVGVETFVNISTDKAANPTSVLGLSKRLAERLTAWAGQEVNRRYLSVRFGNVIGSRGSMLPTFQRLIDEDKPLTVTHPDVTRYFMTIPEACQLVLQAGGIGRIGEVLILDMGEPVRILDIAEQMIALSGKDIPVVFTGLREGEKLDEELHSDHEVEHRPFHPLISHANVNAGSPAEINRPHWEHLVITEPKDRYAALRNHSERVCQ